MPHLITDMVWSFSSIFSQPQGWKLRGGRFGGKSDKEYDAQQKLITAGVNVFGGGFCPVQFACQLDSVYLYFRVRGQKGTIHIGANRDAATSFGTSKMLYPATDQYGKVYGFNANWMLHLKVLELYQHIQKCRNC